jgi:hypothetical protein
MIVTTVLNPPIYCKCFFAQLHGLSGTLAKLTDDKIYFFHQETGDLREVTSYNGLVVLGECGLAMAATILDEMHGGAAKIACSRRMEVL